MHPTIDATSLETAHGVGHGGAWWRCESEDAAVPQLLSPGEAAAAEWRQEFLQGVRGTSPDHRQLHLPPAETFRTT